MDSEDEVRARVLAAAQRHADAQGWRWRPPVEAKITRAAPGDRQWTVRTNILAIGMNVRVVVRESDLAIVDAGYLSR